MVKVIINDVEYNKSDLTDAAKEYFDMITSVDIKINELYRDIAICSTARNTYSRLLEDEMNKNVKK